MSPRDKVNMSAVETAAIAPRTRKGMIRPMMEGCGIKLTVNAIQVKHLGSSKVELAEVTATEDFKYCVHVLSRTSLAVPDSA